MLSLKLTFTIFIFVGLLITLIGAAITARAVVLSDDDAISIGQARYVGETREDNLRLPAVQSLLRQSRAARNGLIWIVIGTALQMIGTMLSLWDG